MLVSNQGLKGFVLWWTLRVNKNVLVLANCPGTGIKHFVQTICSVFMPHVLFRMLLKADSLRCHGNTGWKLKNNHGYTEIALTKSGLKQMRQNPKWLTYCWTELMDAIVKMSVLTTHAYVFCFFTSVKLNCHNQGKVTGDASPWATPDCCYWKSFKRIQIGIGGVW